MWGRVYSDGRVTGKEATAGKRAERELYCQAMAHHMTDDDLREHWNEFAHLFADEIAHNTVLLGRVLIAHLRLEQARSVLEIGAGPGNSARVVAEQMAAGARLTVTDLSPTMIEIARSVLAGVIEAGGIEVEVDAANCEALPYPDGSFDRVIGNLCLMLVGDSDRAIAEAHRVLQPGGIAAWSVWGRPEHSHMFTIPGRAAEIAGVELPEGRRSNFHLGDRDHLRQRVERHGFCQTIAWYQAMIPDVHDGARYADLTLRMPRWRSILDGQPAERVAELRRQLAIGADELLARGEPIGLDALVVVARKS